MKTLKTKSLGRNEKCPVCRGTGKIPTSNWLTAGIPKNESARKKKESLADIVKVVRCRDCKYAYINYFSAQNGVALCSYGERREQ